MGILQIPFSTNLPQGEGAFANREPHMDMAYVRARRAAGLNRAGDVMLGIGLQKSAEAEKLAWSRATTDYDTNASDFIVDELNRPDPTELDPDGDGLTYFDTASKRFDQFHQNQRDGLTETLPRNLRTQFKAYADMNAKKRSMGFQNSLEELRPALAIQRFNKDAPRRALSPDQTGSRQWLEGILSTLPKESQDKARDQFHELRLQDMLNNGRLPEVLVEFENGNSPFIDPGLTAKYKNMADRQVVEMETARQNALFDEASTEVIDSYEAQTPVANDFVARYQSRGMDPQRLKTLQDDAIRSQAFGRATDWAETTTPTAKDAALQAERDVALKAIDTNVGMSRLVDLRKLHIISQQDFEQSARNIQSGGDKIRAEVHAETGKYIDAEIAARVEAVDQQAKATNEAEAATTGFIEIPLIGKNKVAFEVLKAKNEFSTWLDQQPAGQIVPEAAKNAKRDEIIERFWKRLQPPLKALVMPGRAQPGTKAVQVDAITGAAPVAPQQKQSETKATLHGPDLAHAVTLTKKWANSLQEQQDIKVDPNTAANCILFAGKTEILDNMTPEQVKATQDELVAIQQPHPELAVEGLVERGNSDLSTRPNVQNAYGTSTLARSVSVVFETVEAAKEAAKAAKEAAKAIHEQQAAMKTRPFEGGMAEAAIAGKKAGRSWITGILRGLSDAYNYLVFGTEQEEVEGSLVSGLLTAAADNAQAWADASPDNTPTDRPKAEFVASAIGGGAVDVGTFVVSNLVSPGSGLAWFWTKTYGNKVNEYAVAGKDPYEGNKMAIIDATAQSIFMSAQVGVLFKGPGPKAVLNAFVEEGTKAAFKAARTESVAIALGTLESAGLGAAQSVVSDLTNPNDKKAAEYAQNALTGAAGDAILFPFFHVFGSMGKQPKRDVITNMKPVAVALDPSTGEVVTRFKSDSQAKKAAGTMLARAQEMGDFGREVKIEGSEIRIRPNARGLMQVPDKAPEAPEARTDTQSLPTIGEAIVEKQSARAALVEKSHEVYKDMVNADNPVDRQANADKLTALAGQIDTQDGQPVGTRPIVPPERAAREIAKSDPAMKEILPAVIDGDPSAIEQANQIIDGMKVTETPSGKIKAEPLPTLNEVTAAGNAAAIDAGEYQGGIRPNPIPKKPKTKGKKGAKNGLQEGQKEGQVTEPTSPTEQGAVQNPAPKTLRVVKGWVPYDYTKEGEPLITRVQRPSDFPTFGSGEPDVPGIAGFFTQNRDVADRFTKGSKHGVVGTFDIEPGRVYEIDAKGKKAGDVEFGKTGKEFRDAARSKKYDTIIIKNTADEGDVIVGLNPDKIKIIDSGISQNPELSRKYGASEASTKPSTAQPQGRSKETPSYATYDPMAPATNREAIIAGLRDKGFDGTIDRLERGKITLEQANAELNGVHPEVPKEMGPPNPADFASQLKGQGVGRQESWSRWVQRTSLRPGMDAKDWYNIYDSVAPSRSPSASTSKAKESSVSREPVATEEAKAVRPEAKPEFTKPPLKQIPEEPGREVSRAAERVQEEAIAKDLTSSLGDLPTYGKMNMADQARMAAGEIATDYENAKQMAYGQVDPPSGLRPASIYRAVAVKARTEGDVETLRNLAVVYPQVSEELSRMGQEIKAADVGTMSDPVKAMQDVQKVKEKIVGKRRNTPDIKKEKTKWVKEGKAEIKKRVTHRQSWNEFVNSIKC